jgi:hypothetical protein
MLRIEQDVWRATALEIVIGGGAEGLRSKGKTRHDILL